MTRQRDRRIWRSKVWLWLGALAVLVTLLPYFLLGEDSIFVTTDQLDGEMIAYILRARHLLQRDGFAEFMSGAPRTSLTAPAPLAVLLFLPGNYCGALIALAVLGRLCGYAGMYLLTKEITGREWLAAAAGFLYSCIPFLPVYGLSEFGLPLLLWCGIQLRKGKHSATAYGYVIVYALLSSLVLVGFGVLGAGFLILLWLTFRQRKKGENGGGIARLWTAWGLLLCVYVLENLSLLAELLGGKNVTHKAGYVLTSAGSFWKEFLRSLLQGEQHSAGYHVLLLACTAAAAAAGVFWLRRKEKSDGGAETADIRRMLGVIASCVGWNIAFAVIAGIWKTDPGILLRSRLSFLGAFQLNRVLWLSPCLWYLAAACGMAVLCELYGRDRRYGIPGVCAIAVWGVTACWLLLSGDVKSNIQKLRNPDYGMLSYRDYYGIGVMEQVRDYLEETTGKGVEEYRVVSLGIDPAAALYHGFYCLDGYSNNYPLEYKRQFRRIIAPELEKSDYLRDYFDHWGNRCYLFSAECPGYYTVEKNGFFFQNYEIDRKALYEMGGRYLLSAAYIVNAQEQGLVLLRETPFETEESYYRIYVYEVTS